MTLPTNADHERYAVLVNRIRRARGLLPLPNVVPVDDPRPFIRQMEWQLADLEVRVGQGDADAE